MVVNKKFVYVHMPKTGGTSVSHYLKDNVENSMFVGTGHGHQVAKNIKRMFPKQFLFGTVRNPWDWYVSIFEFNLGGGNYVKLVHGADKDFNKFMYNILTKQKNYLKCLIIQFFHSTINRLTH